MKVLIYSHLYPDGFRSLGCFVHRQARALADQGCHVTVLSPVPWAPPFSGGKHNRYREVPRTAMVEGIRVFYPRYPTVPGGKRLGVQGIGMAIGTWRLLRRLSKDNDLIHAHMVFPDGYAADVIHRVFHLRIPTCVTAHGSDVRTFGELRPTRGQVIQTLRSTAAVVTGHPEIAELIRPLRGDVHLIPNGLDVQRFVNADGAAVREELGISREAPVIVFVANLNPFKDPITFLRAAREVSLKLPDAAFLVVGAGALMPKLQVLSGKLSIENRVFFLGYRRDVPQILKAADVFVATSPVENIWSTTILEAFASQLPCVITDAGTTRQYLRHVEEAFLVSAGNPGSVADGIIEVLSNERLSRAIGLGGYRLVLERFDIRESARRLIDLYTSLTDSNRLAASAWH